MKLKKIASLMLAGIMAVSMLAGCKSGTTTDDEKNPVVPVATNAVKYAEDVLDADVKDLVDVVASTELDGWVHDIATDSSKLTANGISYAHKNNFQMSYNTNSNDDKMTNALLKKLQEKGVVVSGTTFNSVPNGTFSQSYGWMSAVSGQLDEKAAVEAAVSYVGSWIAQYGNASDKVTATDGTIYNCDYTLEVSTLKVSNDSLTNESAWTVAIVLTQNLTKAANVEA
ncbi:MAG TPA: hypothetical protein H9771_09005 [Candidatus Faecalibacterium faecipullorum]|uniref:Lipoprotein n=1 Tax=Candidatus Faecalibacterium faecipullorum TaxID=2838578 RepID=A0A9D2S7Q9_9FIRM|nr:hypothetical protein [Candidatus Faecalibacterium faecipullorum]